MQWESVILFSLQILLPKPEPENSKNKTYHLVTYTVCTDCQEQISLKSLFLPLQGTIHSCLIPIQVRPKCSH